MAEKKAAGATPESAAAEEAAALKGDELEKAAKQAEIPGRSEMTADEKREALAETGVPQEPQTFKDDEYTVDQLVSQSDQLLGCASYVADVALRRFGGDQDYYTLEQATKAVDKFNKHEVEA